MTAVRVLAWIFLVTLIVAAVAPLAALVFYAVLLMVAA